jgi:flagellar basal body-associated protein FliL
VGYNQYNPENKTPQRMSKRSRLPWIIIIGIIILVIIVAAVFLMNPSSQPLKIPAPSSISATDFVAPTAPQPPSCTIAINGQKVPPSSDNVIFLDEL